MARRKVAEDDDSLELFLSTSCDSFGGIVFIMLLICLLPTKKLDNLIAERDRARAQLAQIQSEIDKLQDRAKLASAHAPKPKADPPPLQAQLASAENELKVRELERTELEASLAEAPPKPKPGGELRYTRRPYLHEVDKQTFPIVIFENKVMLPQAGKDFHLNEEDFELVRLPKIMQFKPLSGKGVDTKTWLKSADGLRDVTDRLPRDKIVVNILLYPDSVASFEAVRSAFTAQGYDYNWMPLAPTEPVNLATGGGSGTTKNDAQ